MQSDVFELDQSTGAIYLIRRIRHLAGQQLSLPYLEINRSNFESEEKMVEFEIGNGSVDAPYFHDEVLRLTVEEDAAIGESIVVWKRILRRFTAYTFRGN